MSYAIECLADDANHLGEGPVWDVEEGALYWVDGTGRRAGKPSIWRLDPRTGRKRNWSLDHDVGAMALRRDGGAVLALDDGFYFFDFGSGALDLIEKIEMGMEWESSTTSNFPLNRSIRIPSFLL